MYLVELVSQVTQDRWTGRSNPSDRHGTLYGVFCTMLSNSVNIDIMVEFHVFGVIIEPSDT